jgi:hypothetical protein
MVVHTYNPSPMEEEKGSKFPGLSGLGLDLGEILKKLQPKYLI